MKNLYQSIGNNPVKSMTTGELKTEIKLIEALNDNREFLAKQKKICQQEIGKRKLTNQAIKATMEVK